MKGVYLCAFRDYLDGFDIDYNDIKLTSPYINLCCSCLDVDLSNYDFIIASPPCNFWSRSNYRRLSSAYALSTKHLLPALLIKCSLSGKPFIIENVRNDSLFEEYGIFDICDNFGILIYKTSRHTYFTNHFCNLSDRKFKSCNIQNISKNKREGSMVHDDLLFWLNSLV